jgi:hypothetical protein
MRAPLATLWNKPRGKRSGFSVTLFPQYHRLKM